MEIFWLVTSIVLLIIAIMGISKKGFENSFQLLFFPPIAFLLYFLRRYWRKKIGNKGGK
jgi:F0F1-type ATP synthase membrane subunit a